MRQSARKSCIALVVAAVLGGSIPAFAAESAEAFVHTRQDQLTSLLRQGKADGKDQRVTAILDGMLDYQELARRSLASHWSDLSEKDRAEFVGVLKRLVSRTYQKNIQSVLDYDVEYSGEEKGGDGVTVHTRASSKKDAREEPVTIDYRMLPAAQGWRVYDIVTEGSSLVTNYRNQFHRIIQKDGYKKLVERMQQRLNQGEQTSLN